MPKAVRTFEHRLLKAIAAHGGANVDNLQLQKYIGDDALTPIYCGLQRLSNSGLVQSGCFGRHVDGSPSRGWSLTGSGRAILARPPRRSVWRRITERMVRSMGQRPLNGLGEKGSID